MTIEIEAKSIWKVARLKACFVLLSMLLICSALTQAEPTTEVRLVKYAEDGTILGERTVSYHWMEENLAILGNGATHYYHQGPVFQGDKWDPLETSSFKDKGAVKGTDLKDLCDLVGGAGPGDEIQVHCDDGYTLEFGRQNVYEPDPKQGPLVLCWYCGSDVEGFGEVQGTGYPPDYYAGMRLVFFADNSTNQEGKHVFGNWDMHESFPDARHHFYDLYPSTNGFSAKWIDEIRIYSGSLPGTAWTIDSESKLEEKGVEDVEEGAKPDNRPSERSEDQSEERARSETMPNVAHVEYQNEGDQKDVSDDDDDDDERFSPEFGVLTALVAFALVLYSRRWR